MFKFEITLCVLVDRFMKIESTGFITPGAITPHGLWAPGIFVRRVLTALVVLVTRYTDQKISSFL